MKGFVVLCVTGLVVIAGTTALADGRGPALPRGAVLIFPVAPASLAVGWNGDLYIADPGRQQILERSPDGGFHAVAGTGVAGLSGDGGPALEARIEYPGSLALGADGTLYFSQAGPQVNKAFGNMTSSVVREVTPQGTIRTLAGLRPNCSAVRPSATSVRAESAELYGADLSLGPGGALRVSAVACPDNHSLGPSLELTRSGLLVLSGGPPAPAAVNCGGWGAGGTGFTAFSCLSGAAGTRYSHPNELLVVRGDGSFSSYPTDVGQEDLLASSASGEVVAAHNFSIVQVTASAITTLASERELDRLFPGAPGVAAVNGLAVERSGGVFVAPDYYTRARHGCGEVIAERTTTGQLKVLWRSGAGLTCG
jgi:hypothetical protein